MRNNIMLATILVLATTAPALAGGKEGSIGAGAEFGLNGLTGGASANYDAGKFHFGGFLGFFDGGDDDDTDYTFGARFYYHVHESSLSDFGVGGAIGFYSQDNMAPLERDTLLFFEPGVQIRAFLSNNVALSFTTGISFALVDADGAKIGGTDFSLFGAGAGFNAIAGVHYYFFQ
jgi:hypothetical protein